MANRIIRLVAIGSAGTAAMTWAGADVDGAQEVEFSEEIERRLGQSDGELGPVTSDTVREGFAGSITVSDEDVDITLLTGAVGVLVFAYKIQGGSKRNVTIGNAGAASGVVFTRSRATYDRRGGNPTITTRLDFVGIYPPGATKTFGSSAEVAAGTALVAIV